MQPEAETYITWFAVVAAVFYCRVFIQRGVSDTAYLRSGQCAPFSACFPVTLPACTLECRLPMPRLAFGPLVTKPVAIAACHTLLRFLRKEEKNLFLLSPPTK